MRRKDEQAEAKGGAQRGRRKQEKHKGLRATWQRLRQSLSQDVADNSLRMLHSKGTGPGWGVQHNDAVAHLHI